VHKAVEEGYTLEKCVLDSLLEVDRMARRGREHLMRNEAHAVGFLVASASDESSRVALGRRVNTDPHVQLAIMVHGRQCRLRTHTSHAVRSMNVLSEETNWFWIMRA
jgi:hypothetical protein